MSKSGQALDRVAVTVLAPLLKARGFRKSGRTWRRPVTNLKSIQVINIQGSLWNSDSAGRCALNAGIYFPALAELLGIGRVTDTPTEPDCHLRVRPAMLRPSGQDTWFEFQPDDETSVQAAGEAIADLYSDFADPWLERFSAIDSARDELARTGQLWWAAAASLELGDRDAARSQLATAIHKAPKTYAPHLVRWGAAHLLPDSRGPAI